MKWLITICASVAMLLLTAGAANAVLVFEDNFDSPTLDPEWVISPGAGNLSLTDNPGSLRYTVDAYLTSYNGGYDSSGNQVRKSLWVTRPFEGNQWVLRAAVTFNLRPGQPTNNRDTFFSVRQPGVDGTGAGVWMAAMDRGIGANDDNPGGTNAMQFFNSVVNGPRVIFPPSPGPVPPDRWYLEIERNGDQMISRASNDGDDSTFEYQWEYTFAAGYLTNNQIFEFWGMGWKGSNNPPGYVDFDFIRIVPEPATIVLLVTGGLLMLLRWRKRS